MASTSSPATDSPAGETSPAPGSIGTALLDARGAWEVVDAGLCQLLGRTEDELLALPVAAVVNPDDLARERVRLEQLLAGGLLTYRSESRLLHADGHAIWALLDAAAIVDADGVGRCLLQLQDISSRKRLELSGTGWAFGEADLDDGPGVVAVKDSGGDYLRVNLAFEAMFAVSDERLRGRPDEYLFPQSVAAALRAADRDAMAAPGRGDAEPAACEDVFPQADGDRRLESLRFPLLGATARPCGVCAISFPPEQRDAAAGQAAALLTLERAARDAARRARDELMEIERAQRAQAGTARESVLARVAVGGRAPAPRTPFVFEPEDRERTRLVELERAASVTVDELRERLREEEESAAEARAALDRAHAERDEAGQALRAERAARVQAEAQRDRLREQADARAAEAEAERAAKARVEPELARVRDDLDAQRDRVAQFAAELTRLREAAVEHKAQLESEQAARLDAERERDRLLEAEHAAGERVPLPALAPETPRAVALPGAGADADTGTEVMLAAWRAEGEAQLTWALAEATASYEGAREALALAGETLGWSAGACYAREQAGGPLRCCAFWQAAQVGAHELETLSWQASFRRGGDVVGKVLEEGEVAWVEDVGGWKGSSRAKAAASAGLHSMVAVPVIAGDETLGVLELFSADARPRDEGVVEAMREVGVRLGQFMERSQAEFARSRYGLIHR